MASVRVYSAALHGLDAIPIEVEVDTSPGLHFFTIVGLPDKTVEESKDRIASAIRNSGFVAPKQKNNRIIVNLAPADIKKEGPGYDLPISIGYLIATKQIKCNVKDSVIAGELSLDGSLRKINGVLSIALTARQRGFSKIIVPRDNAHEAAIIDGIQVIGAQTLHDVALHLEEKVPISPTPAYSYAEIVASSGEGTEYELDMADIKGQESAKRALLIAGSGGHNILMHGPPGSGKTLLARALAGIMPPMSKEEALEVTKIYSVSGLLGEKQVLVQRPFRNPHHTTSAVAIVGGGSWPKPGEISLAHRGVLFLDEFPEFPRSVIEALRQPMENGKICVSRASSSVMFPARFMLVAAMNPCPCGNYQDEQIPCVCPQTTVVRYQKKISGPILDRLDIQIQIPRETYDKLSSSTVSGPSTADMRTVVTQIRNIQKKRFRNTVIITNSEMGPKEIAKFCNTTTDAEKLIRAIMTAHNISGRGYHKLLKIGRTIADMDSSDIIDARHIAEAAGYRIKTNVA